MHVFLETAGRRTSPVRAHDQGDRCFSSRSIELFQLLGILDGRDARVFSLEVISAESLLFHY